MKNRDWLFSSARWNKSIEKFQANLIEKSNKMYDQLLEEQVLPAMEREKTEELSIQELETIATALEEVVDDYMAKIDMDPVF